MFDGVPPLLVIFAIAALAPYLAEKTGSLRIPVAVFEILLGAALGPQGLGWIAYERGVPYLATMGMTFLFFLAGVEIDLGAMRGPPLRLASIGWLLSLGLAFSIAFGLSLTLGITGWPLVAVALATTALGIVAPILRDAELSETNLGKFTLACGAIGEIGPIILMSVLLSHEHGVGVQLGLVVAFAVVVLGVFWASLSVRPPGVIGALSRTMTKSGQLPVRVSLVLTGALVLLAEKFGLDLALGAFAAGMAVGLALRDSHDPLLHHKFDAVGFGFLVPVFFVASGMQLDVRALFGSPLALGMMPVYSLLLLLIRGLPVLIFRRELEGRELCALGFYSATSLSLIVALTGTAVQRRMMLPETGAALVGGGLLSVLVYPVIAMRLGGRKRSRWPLGETPFGYY